MRTEYGPVVRYLVLGPMEVEAAPEPIALGGRKQKLVLAHLLRRPNGWVSTETLIDDVWGEEPPGAAKSSLQSYVSNLRKALGAERLETGAGGYRLVVGPGELDALEFEQTSARANAEVGGDPREASDLFRRALGLWRGSAFSDLADEPSLLSEIGRLEEERLQAIEGRIDADLALGRHTEVVAELDELTHRWPLREHLWAQRMLALYRAERPAEALAAYREARSTLVDELGVEPGRPLQQLNERILLQDPELDLPTASAARETSELDNPYKGLRPFREGDEQDFHGREALTGLLVATLEDDARLVTLIGPSGSGKSSVVSAGLVPSLRKRHVGDRWQIASMRPGAYPFTEFDAAMGRTFPSSTSADLRTDRDTWLLEAVLRALPEDGSRLLLVIDQFEELFTLVDDEARNRFLAGLVAAADEPGDRVRVLVVLRADFFDRPLAYPVFGRLMTEHIVHVLPLGPGELEAAAAKPAERVGVTFEPGLLAELVGDVSRQPNALPLFQYALTELFDRREGDELTLARYEALGGLRGAVASRAEDTFTRLDPDRQEAARQLFLRLVRVGAGAATRRVVQADELASLDIDLVTMQDAVEAFVSNRLLAVDRDPASGAATVEVAHEALLSEWQRLAEWIEGGRADLRQHRSLVGALQEWLAADRDHDYLLSGGRLDRYEAWREATAMRLTEDERMFLDEAVRLRDEAAVAEAERAEAETRMRTRGRRRSFAVGVGAAALIAALMVGVVLVGGEEELPTITSLTYGDREDSMVFELGEQGVTRAEQELGVTVQRADVLLPPETVVEEAAAAGTDLLILDSSASFEIGDQAGLLVKPTHYVLSPVEVAIDRPNVTTLEIAFEQSGFLAGVAAASTTRSGVIGYVGAWEGEPGGPSVVFQSFRAGYEAGADWVDPDVQVLSGLIYDFTGPFVQYFDAPQAAKRIARIEYDMGADVVFHATGQSGAGVFGAAVERSTPDRHLWAIGVDTDQWQQANEDERSHILTSSMIRWDIVHFTVIRDFVEGTLQPGARRLTVDEGIITYSGSGDSLSPGAVANLDRAIEAIAEGEIDVPTEPVGELLQP